MPWSRGFVLLVASVLAGCAGELPITPLEDAYQLDVATTRSAYLPSDSVYVRVTNRDSWTYVWHRCPGLLLERQIPSGWAEVTDGSTCTPGQIVVPDDGDIFIGFVLPPPSPPGEYRVRIRLSAVDARPPYFWWPSEPFSVGAR